MNAKQFYDQLASARVELWCQGKMLRFRAPDGVLDEPTMANLRKFKRELIEIIGQSQCNSSSSNSDDTRLEPATIGQQALYFLHLSAPYSPAYNVASACQVDSLVPTEAIVQAFERLIDRHESLRTTMTMKDGQLRRKIATTGRLDFQSINAKALDEQSLSTLVRKHYQEPFDLEHGPLMRVRWFEQEQGGVLLLVLHHIIFDAWSLWIVQDEFFQLLGQELGIHVAALPAPRATFNDFVNDQSRLLNSPEGLEQLEYWRSELRGPLPSLELPTDHARPKRGSAVGATHRFRISTEMTARIRRCSQRLGVTPFALTLSIFKVLLHRMSGQSDLVVGITTSGRTSSQFTPVVGYFVNSLAIRTDLDDDPTFTQYAGRVKTKVLGAIKNASYPLAALLDRIKPHGSERSQGGVPPLFNVMFGLQKPRWSEAATLHDDVNGRVDVAGLSIGCFELDQQEGQFDLVMELFESNDSFSGSLKYDTEIFDAKTAERLCDRYVALCDSILSNPDLPVSKFDWISTSETDSIRSFCAGTNVPAYDRGLPFQWVERFARETPNQQAVVGDGFVLTYRELDALATRIASGLKQYDLHRGSVFGTCFGRDPNAIAAILAVWKIGGTIVPLDVDSPDQRNLDLLRRCKATALLTNRQLSTDGQLGLEACPTIDLLTLLDSTTDLTRQEHLDEVGPDDAAYILHTSGSTGQPKGVCVSHGAFAEHIAAMSSIYEMESTDRVLQFSNFTFDPFLEQLGVAWFVGATTVFRGDSLWSPEVLWDNVAKHRVTTVNLPPIYFEHCQAALEDSESLSSLRLMILGGDVFPAKAMSAWRHRGVRVLNAYGPTEAVITATIHDVDLSSENNLTTPIGRPRPGCRAYVLDAGNQLCGIGVPGRLFLAGPLLADGYWLDQEATNKVFVSESLVNSSSTGRMYDTGDVAKWNASGELEFVGRKDYQTKIDGIRTDMNEIETAIKLVDNVRRCVVAVRSDSATRELVAWIETKTTLVNGSADALEKELLVHLRSNLPRHMVPRQIIFVDKMPMTASGKINRQALPAPQQRATPTRNVLYVAPRNDWEQKMADIWADELSVSSVGIHDDFFELGGASLSSLRIVARANDCGLAGRESVLRPEVLFQYVTIAELHDHLVGSSVSSPQTVESY